ncbi:hypothetical protein QTL95_26925 [Rhizobium sp. S152]|uniref:hypothetical protein n=1 Tax=Rhizobium sp. S152 TaxID=3055038 RepID=UPI0025AA0B50|nr:hypothetical protein [Rhizobium sp. S152]MDM9629522.1 hypothetical protein [Rhizobium sp. S152]
MTQSLTKREQLELRIEEMIALLDLLDGDPDLEENGDERDVGMPACWAQSYKSGQTLILEDDEDGGDTEPNGDELDTGSSEDEGGVGPWH